MSDYTNKIIADVKAKNPSEPEYHQAVEEVMGSLELVLQRHTEYRSMKILERMTEPERVIMFRVPWLDDQGEIRWTKLSQRSASALNQAGDGQ